MNYILLILFVFECVSILGATYMFMLGDWTKVVQKVAFDDYSNYVLLSYIVALFLGWCIAPIFVLAILKSNQ